MKELLNKAMESIALEYIGGNVPIDVCIKACESYNTKLPPDDQFKYDLIVSKSCIDSINGIGKDEELNKAITPFQTKVIDGVMYIYTPTRVGSKLEFDWHVVKQGNITKKDIGKGSKLTQKELAQAYKYINNLFPKDLSSVKVLNVAVGGSTGAKMVQDVNGIKYIRKRGDGSSLTNNGHVKNEYLSAQLYNLMGLNAPELELYDDNGVNVTLSKFIAGCHESKTAADAKALAQGFIVDCIMDNRDVYRNDNCLIDPSGKVYRVDNGGCLNYRAQGAAKPFDDDILKTFNNMISYNPAIYAQLSNKDILNQIKAVRSVRDDVVNFLKETGEDSLAKIMGQRIDKLSEIEMQLAQNQNIEDTPIPKNRKLKSAKQMYRQFTQKELDDFWNSVQGGYSKIWNELNSNNTYAILSQVCAARGFDGLPEVCTDDDFWKKHSNSDLQCFRGIHEDQSSKNLSLYSMQKNLLFDAGDKLFYGNSLGGSVYGEGLYFHVNNGSGTGRTRDTYKNGAGYKHAVRYGNSCGSRKGCVITGCLADDTNIVDYKSLENEIRNLNFASDKKEYDKKRKEFEKLNDDIQQLEGDISSFNDKLKAGVYKQYKYDEQKYGLALTELDSIDWGKVTAFGDRDIPSFHDMVETRLVQFVKEQGGSADILHNTVVFSLPNSNKKLTLSINMYDGDYSIHRKNALAPAYNYAIRRFTDWMNSEHVFVAQNALAEEAKNSITKIDNMYNDLYDKRNKRDEINKEMRKMIDVTGDENIYAGIYAGLTHANNPAVVGLYAALKGYDAIRVNFGGNSGRSNDNDFFVVLNRTKLIMSNKIENV